MGVGLQVKAAVMLSLAVLAFAGCAANTSQSAPMTAQELHLHCAAQMYGERTARGRSAPNWLLYDYCMRLARY